MAIELPALPYARDALAPHISAETIDFHYGKHHQAYVTNLNNMLPGTEFEGMELEQIIRKSSGAVFNNAAQIWNHTFYWNCLGPKGGGEPSGKLADAINRDFGSFAQFKEQFSKLSIGTFGSGWGWLVLDGDKLAIMKTPNGENPLMHGKQALLGIDVWEHAYYLDYRNRRPDYVQAWLDHLVDWNAVAARLG
ncbi:MAG: superoxide dismutase [Rhodobacteraceae bacterium]|nr:superoxide dismutase [Paracoccaceae bacterium]